MAEHEINKDAGPDNQTDELDITFFVPCFNESVSIIPTLHTILTAIKTTALSYEIIIIDDASKDDSVEKVRSFMGANPDLPITLIVQTNNQNLGFNFAEAAFQGRGRYFKQLNGKNDTSAEDLKRMLSYVGSSDLVLFYCDFKKRPLLRRVISQGFTMAVNLINHRKIHYYNGLPIFLRADVLRWHAQTHGFGYNAILVTRLLAQGRSYQEIEVGWHDRQGGCTSVFRVCNLLSVLHALVELLAIRLGGLCYKTRVPS